MTEVTIVPCIEDAELYRRYDGQHQPQPCFIALDLSSGRLWADYNPHIGSGTDMEVFLGFVRHWGIPCLTSRAVNAVFEEIAPLAQRVLDDWGREWNGQNMVAALGDDATAAVEQISERLGEYRDQRAPDFPFADSDQVVVWDVDGEGAVNGCEAEDYGITADTIDARLREIAREITAALRDCGDNPQAVVIVHGLDRYLSDLREQARATTAETEDEH